MFGIPWIWLYIIAGFAAAALLSWFVHDQRSIGGASEREKQVKENAQFSDKARKGIVDRDACDDAGGLYDFRKATCQLPPAK